MSIKVEIGQEVAIVGRVGKSTGWIVERVTPTGRIAVRKGDKVRRFNAHGNEIGESSYWCSLDLDVAKVRAEIKAANAKHAARMAMNAIAEVLYARPDDLDQMEAGLALVAERLAAARDALAVARAAVAS